jgi:hypothetical protein
LDNGIYETLLEKVATSYCAINVQDETGAHSELILTQDALKMKFSRNKIEVPWSQFDGIELSTASDKDLLIVYKVRSESLCRSFHVEQRVDRDMVALVIRAFHGLSDRTTATEMVGAAYAKKWISGVIRKKSVPQGKIALVRALQSDPPVADGPTTVVSAISAARNTLAMLKKMTCDVSRRISR